MSIPPPGLGGGAARTGPPPGFGTLSLSGGGSGHSGSSAAGSLGAMSERSAASNSHGSGGGGGRREAEGGGTAVIVKAQIVFLLTTFTEESFEKGATEIRALASSHGPEMYQHYLRRATSSVVPIITKLLEHARKYKDDPAAPPPDVQTTGHAALVWRLLVGEAVRASRDISLAPHFCLCMLTPGPQPNAILPLPSLGIFNLPPAMLFTLSTFALASPNIFNPSTVPGKGYDLVRGLRQQTIFHTMNLLEEPRRPFWQFDNMPGPQPYSDDLSPQEAQNLILALYPPQSPPSAATASQGTPSRPPSPNNPTQPDPLASSWERGDFLTSLAIKFDSPAIILQTITALSPGGPPRSPGSIPLEHALFELGPYLAQDDAAIEAIIGQWWGPYLRDSASLTEEAICTIQGICQGMLSGRKIDAHRVIKAMSQIDGISFYDVVRSFDSPGTLQLVSAAVKVLPPLLYLPSQSPVPPVAGLVPASVDAPVWTNLARQVELLSAFTAVPPDSIPLFTIPHPASPSSFARIIDPPINDTVWSPEARAAAEEVQGAGILNTLGLIKVVVEALRQMQMVAEAGDLHDDETDPDSPSTVGNIAQRILDQAARFAPEMTLVALERLPKPLPALAAEMHKGLFGLYFNSRPNEVASYHLVWHKLMEVSPEGLAEQLQHCYEEDETCIGRVLEIARDVGLLPQLLGSSHPIFALEVAAAAAKESLIDLEKFLADGVYMKGHDFLDGIFDFAEHKIHQEMELDFGLDPASKPPHALDSTIYSIIIRVIRQASGLTREDIGRFKNLRSDILVQHSRLLNLYPGSKKEQGFEVANFDTELQKRIDEMLGSLYRSEAKLDDIVDELSRLQKSDDHADREYFACALHALFEEYRFVGTYPAKEVIVTGILFGALIDRRIVKDTAAFVATRYVLDACKTAPTEPFFQFGINALSILRPSLVDFPGLCRSLLEIPTLHESHPVLINEIMAALTEREELDQQGGVKLAFPALRLPVLIEEGDDEFREPDEETSGAIMFIVNQIAPSNFDSKAQDLVKLFQNEYSRWFAHYFIDVRVSLEANRHEIYLALIETLKSPLLERHILWETLRKARDLLNSEASMSSATERATLKTIATWLGRITLARNKPIRFKELSIKDLLIQGYDNKRLIVAIPFVCNLMTWCKDSTIFRPPNPWLVAVLSLLVEFYHYAELRLNLKFEIEVLFSKLEIELQTFESSTLLRTHTPPPEPQAEQPNRLDAEYRRATAELLNGGGERFVDQQPNDSFMQIQQVRSEQAAAETQAAYLRRVDELIAALPRYLVFSGDYPIFTAPTTKRIVNHSIDRAVREIVQAVVDRSCTIAGIATRDLVQKDYGTEGDPLKMRQAAHSVGSNLAGQLALVTCKEPLRTSMATNIRQMLSGNGFTEENMPEPQIAGVINDNLDAACKIITTAAMEKAVKDIDVNLAPQYNARKAHIERGNQQSFWDASSFGVRMANSAMPDPLRLRQGGLTQEQLRVYEDFGEPTRLYASAPGSINGGGGGGEYYNGQDAHHPELKRGPSPRNLFPPDMSDHAMDSGGMVNSPQPVAPQTSIERFQDLVGEIEKFLSQSQQGQVSAALPEDVRRIMRGIIMMAGQSANREQTTLVISQKIVQLLYKTTLPIGREIYVLILRELCDLAPKVDAEVKTWLVYADDPRKLNVPVTVLLIRARFINPAELDAQLAHMLRNNAPDVMDFVAELVRECSLGEQAIAPRETFAQSLTALLKTRMTGRATPTVEAVLEELRANNVRPRDTRPQDGALATPQAAPGGAAVEDSTTSAIDQEKLSHFFLEWVRAFSTSKRPEAAFVPYIQYLQKEGILNGEDISSAFYRTAINCAVDLDTAKLNVPDPKFYGTDALAKLIVLIVKNYGDKSGSSSVTRAVYYYNKIITIMSYSLVQRQLEAGDAFNQRPWARFFTSMLSELAQLESSLPDTYMGCLKTFANDLGITQPTYAPRFAFGWVSIISHRLFMGKLLAPQNREEGWPAFHRALMWLLRFLSPFLRSADMSNASRSLYRATLRLLLVVMHDFPEFLVEYYHTLATAIPTQCVQLRNIVLAAFPTMDGAPLPSYYKRLDLLQEDMQHIPVIRADLTSCLSSGGLKPAIDQYVAASMPALGAIVGELKNRIAIKSMNPDGTTSVTWDHTLLHAAVFYLGTSFVQRIYNATGIVEFDSQAPEVALLTNLAFALDAEGQYYMLSVVADQLRYPSAHTLFFSSFLLFLFGTAAATQDAQAANDTAAPSGVLLPEVIARILLERVVVSKPHPWGLIVTFVELLENERYGFWKQSCIRGEEDVFMMFRMAQQKIQSAAGSGSTVI